MVDDVLFSRQSDKWETPADFYALLDGEFRFDLDPCCTHENAKTRIHYTKEDDGLVQSWWHRRVFVNPPYSQNQAWVEKCCLAARDESATVVLLIPSRTDTAYWHDWVMDKASEIRFVKGRLIFGSDEYWQWRWETQIIDGKANHLYGKFGRRDSAPFPSAVIVYRPGKWRFTTVSAMERR